METPTASSTESAVKKPLPLFNLSRNVFLFGVVSFLTDLSSDMIIPLLPLFITEVLRVKISWLGIVEGVAETTASVFKLLSGWISDRLGKRKVVVLLGYSLSTMSRPLMALATLGWHVLLVRFFDRIGKGIRGSPRDALIAESCPREGLGRAFGFHRAMDNLGGVLGPLAASGILLFFPGDYRLVFWCAFVPGILTLPLILLAKETPKAGPDSEATPRKPLKLTLKPFDARFRYYLLVILVFTLGNSTDMFLLARARDLGMPDPAIPMFWLVLQLVKMVFAFPGGILGDRYGRKRLLILGWIIYAVAYVGFGLATHLWQFWALIVLYGVFYGCTEGGERALVSDLVPSEYKGTAYGVFNFTTGVGLFPASVITGWLYGAQWAGPAVAFSFCALMALIAAGMLTALRTDQCASH